MSGSRNAPTPSGSAPSAAPQHSLARARKGSSTSLSSLPTAIRLAQPSALKPPSADVQLDLSSASASDHPSLLTAARSKSKTISPAATSSKPSARANIIDSSEVWRSSAAKRAEKAWAIQSEKSLYSDPKFKKYSNLVERTLATFDSVSEWADFISFLSRLLKSVQAYPNFNVVPRKLIVAKRLAQCLNPALPSGVHQRALDVYSHILAVIGPDGLRRDLQIWTSGLLPFFQYASTSVKPSLLDIYDKHYLPLHEDLRPIARALLLALLPGLEEETGEFFDRTLKLLDSVSHSVGQDFFLQCLWLVLITTPSTRLAALNYLTKRMPDLGPEVVDPTRSVGKDVGLMVRGFAHALEDETLLVRRNALELLVTHLRMDRPLFQRHVKANDKVILVRAALSVVLRRDLSLNRRLYSWLLGADDAFETQMAYLRSHGLGLVRQALKEDFERDTDSDLQPDAAERQRPYKIFVSLLDKWEIGQPLTEVLVLDAFRALSRQMTRQVDDEIATTANVLFEVVDPYLLYSQFFSAVRSQFGQKEAEAAAEHSTEAGDAPISAVELLCFALKSFRFHDEETKQIHVPTLFAALLQLVDNRLKAGIAAAEDIRLLLDALELLKLLLDLIPARVFGRRTHDQPEDGGTAAMSDFVSRADAFYAPGETDAEEAAQRFRSFEDEASTSALLRLCADVTSRLGNIVKPGSSQQQQHQEMSVRILDIFADLLRLLDAPVPAGEAAAARLDWDVAGWAPTLLDRLSRAGSFAEVERMIEVLISCALLTSAGSRIDLGGGDYFPQIATSLLFYMEPDRSPYQIRAAELLWAAQKVTSRGHLERVLCRKLSAPDVSGRIRTMQAFGTLWRLSEDLPCEELWAPLLLILDKLRSSDLEEKQWAEAWLRVNLRSYPKVVDPLFHMLLASRPPRRANRLELDGLQIDILEYTRPYDQQQSLYALQTLAALSRFSGQGFARALKSNSVSASVERLLTSSAGPSSDTEGARSSQASYLDVLLDQCLGMLRAYPDEALRNSMRKNNNAVQAAAIDLVQILVQKGQLSPARLREIERIQIEALLIATATGAIEGQNRLLHALHSTITARASGPVVVHAPERVFSTSSTTMDAREDGPTTQETVGPTKARLGITAHPLFLPMVQRGLAAERNRPILQHWSDFVLMAMPFFRSSVNGVLLPINASICDLIRSITGEVEKAFVPASVRATFGADLAVQAEDVSCLSSEMDLTLLISLSERILLQALGEELPQHGPSREPSTTQGELREKATSATQDSGPGLLGYVSNVFSADQSGAVAGKAGAAVAGRTRALQDTVQTLHGVWTMTYMQLSQRDAKALALESIVTKVRLRARRALERIYRAQSADVVESLLECWQRSRVGEGERDGPRITAVFDILEVVAASAQIVVTYLCDVLSTRVSGSGEKARKTASSFAASDASLFAFTDAYLARMPQQEAPQVWPVMILLVKDFVASSTSRKLHIFPVLRILTTLGEKLCQTTAIEDRRMRRDLQDTYVKLVDSAILIAGRSYDQSTWIRRSGKANDEELDLESSGIIEKDDKAAIPGVDVAGMTLIDAINEFLATRAVPALRRFQVDGDKIMSIAANAVYYIVAPSFRVKSKALDVDANVLSLVGEMVKLPGSLKAWRGAVGDLFQDNRFFTMTPALAERWKPIILSLMLNDKERLVELIGRITSAASANIFTNRELEMLTRAFNLRRLSFVIFSGERDAFLAQLPSIQERVVDLLRSNVSELVHAEVYLCMRVLLCRFSARHLSSFWPVIITELMRLFEGMMDELPPDESDQLQLVLSACKFLDLLLVLQTEDFQVHQWMFVTDTVDVVYAPDDWVAESIMDRLATMPPTESMTASTQHEDPFSFDSPSDLDHATLRGGSSNKKGPGAGAKKRRTPHLNARRHVGRIEELLPFLQRISLDSYEAVYHVGVRTPNALPSSSAGAPATAATAAGAGAGAGGAGAAGSGTVAATTTGDWPSDDVDWRAVELGLLGDMFEGVSAAEAA
ncbi:related to DOP1 - strong similarity to developmental regulatory gene, dopey (dopA) [Pseudozyma flocculosa]|uniref:Related to DOP1 - strong similarity to developmental regulatory gene, dopey (DopA) n=1 Tax=Pseudozyma flocculosa TaxID=84751 RepID=A0A5C3F4W4_9BASI|nr:related to DOP1 - strong similarity to developmental regulatory gene, dopey (dopA) [Pseudozyma flocculosa]